MMLTGFEDGSRPRAATLAASIVLLQTALWILGLVWMVVAVQAVILKELREPLEGWILPIRNLVWHQLKPRFAEAFAITILAFALLKRQGWARRLLELAVLVRALLPLPDAKVLLSLGPILWRRYEWTHVGFTLLPLLLPTLPMPLILLLLERSETSAWFRGRSEEGDASPESAAPRKKTPGLRRVVALGAVLAVLATGWLYWRRAPLGKALRIRTARIERRQWRQDLFDSFVVELENTSDRSIVLAGGTLDLLTPGANRDHDHLASFSTGTLIEPGQSNILTPGSGRDLSSLIGDHFLLLALCYGDKWVYRPTLSQVFVLRFWGLEASARPPDLQTASEAEAAPVRQRASEFRILPIARAPDGSCG